MNQPKFIYLLPLLFTLACSNTATSQKSGQPEQITGSQTEQPEKTTDSRTAKTANSNQKLQKQIEQIASAAKGRVGVSAVVLETGETIALNSKERFPMQSVYKFPIGMAILRQIDQGNLQLDQKVRVEKSDFVKPSMRSPIRDQNPNGTETTVRELLRLAVSESDGTASDVLLDLAGGASAMEKFFKEIQVDEIMVLDSEKEIGRDWQIQYKNWATPDGAISLLRALHERRGISEANQKLLLKWMVETPTGANRLKKLLPKTAVVAHKTGTSGSRDGVTAATNDIGFVKMPNGKHLFIAVFVSDSPADEAVREAVIAQIAKAVWDEWANKK